MIALAKRSPFASGATLARPSLSSSPFASRVSVPSVAADAASSLNAKQRVALSAGRIVVKDPEKPIASFADYRARVQSLESAGGGFGSIGKAFKRIGGQIARTAEQAGKQIKRSTAVASPVLLGPALGEKVGIRIARSAGQTAQKATLKAMSRVSRVSGTVVQAAGTVVAGAFTAGLAAAPAYAVTGAAKNLGQHYIKKEQFKRGYTTRDPGTFDWRGEAIKIGSTAASLVGAAGRAVGGAIGGQIAGIASNAGLGALRERAGSVAQGGAAGYAGDAGAAGAAGFEMDDTLFYVLLIVLALVALS